MAALAKLQISRTGSLQCYAKQNNGDDIKDRNLHNLDFILKPRYVNCIPKNSGMVNAKWSKECFLKYYSIDQVPLNKAIELESFACTFVV